MTNLEKKIFESLENNQLEEFKQVLTKNAEINASDICSMFNICMLEIDQKKEFAKHIWENFNNILSNSENKRLLDSFSTYWTNAAKNFYSTLKTKKISIPKVVTAINNTDSKYIYDTDFLKTIKQVRSKLSNLLSFQVDKFSEANHKLIIDVFTFLTFKCAGSSDVLDFDNNAFIDAARSIDFNSNLASVPMNFKNILNHLIVNLNLEDKVSVNYLDEILNDKNLQKYPDANVALNIYLLKGKFNWVPLGLSSFGYYINNSSDLDFSGSEPQINCWEAVLYGLYKANVISLDNLKNVYNSDVNITDSISSWFCYKEANPINLLNWRESLSDKSKLLLGDSHDVGNGLSHVMISVPFSEKQLLKMLITKDFNEKPCNLKLYSHWSRYTDRKLGSISKKNFDKLVCDDLTFRARNIADTFGLNK